MLNIDLIILIIFAICIIGGFNKGFVEGLASLISTIGGFILALIFKTPLALSIFEKLNIHARLIEAIKPTINEQIYKLTAVSGTPNLPIQQTIVNIPQEQLQETLAPIQGSIDKVMFITKDLSTKIFESVDLKGIIQTSQGNVVDTVTNALADKIDKIVLFILGVICFIGIFFLSKIILSIIARALTTLLDAIPLFGKFNHLLGIVTGVVKGALYSVITVSILFIATAIPQVNAKISRESITNSNSAKIFLVIKDQDISKIIKSK